MEMFDELPNKIQVQIYSEFLFKDFLESFETHFILEKPELEQCQGEKYFEWANSKYSEFMIKFLRVLEPR